MRRVSMGPHTKKTITQVIIIFVYNVLSSDLSDYCMISVVCGCSCSCICICNYLRVCACCVRNGTGSDSFHWGLITGQTRSKNRRPYTPIWHRVQGRLCTEMETSEMC